MKRTLAVAALLLVAGLSARAEEPAKPVAVALPGGAGGLRLDDFYFDAALGKVVVPAGRTGQLDLVDPKTREVTTIDGFPAPTELTGPAGGGLTAADAGDGVILATDRTDKKLYVIDGAAKKIVGSAALAAGPDYVRWMAPTKEVWVTEPHNHQIEIFSLTSAGGTWTPKHEALITDKDEFEALAVDAARGLAYSDQNEHTLVIDLKSRKIAARWKNGCKASEGLVYDAKRSFLIVACSKPSKAFVLDAAHGGKRLGSVKTPEGLDIIAFSPSKSHVYLPGKSGTLAVAGVADDGKLKSLATIETSKGVKAAAADDQGGIWLLDGKNGRALYLKDSY